MIRVKLDTICPEWPLLRQTPDESGKWGPFFFHKDADVDECDAWVVFEGLHKAETTVCPSDCTIFVTGEPESIKKYSKEFLSQFRFVISGHRDLPHDNVIHLQQGHPWFVEKNFDELKGLGPVSKQKILCVVSSNKSFTNGHRQRLLFIEEMKRLLGDELDVYGKGLNDFPSKWELLEKYKYTLVLENTEEADFLTEKLPDALLAYCFPFYAGCKNVGRYFESGCYETIQIDDPVGSANKIKQCINSPDHYSLSLPKISSARASYLDHYQFFANLAGILQIVLGSSSVKKESLTISPAGVKKDNFFSIRNLLKRRIT